MRGALLLACCAAAAVSACATRSTSAMGAGPATCHAAGAQALLGQKLDEHLQEEALRDSGALRSRVVPAGAAITTEHPDPMRLNITLDPKGRIHWMRCG
jgi:hypothetical protein